MRDQPFDLLEHQLGEEAHPLLVFLIEADHVHTLRVPLQLDLQQPQILFADVVGVKVLHCLLKLAHADGLRLQRLIPPHVQRGIDNERCAAAKVDQHIDQSRAGQRVCKRVKQTVGRAVDNVDI